MVPAVLKVMSTVCPVFVFTRALALVMFAAVMTTALPG